MKRLFASLLAAGLAVACQDHGPAVLPSGPQAAISDGAHSSGNPDFFFLPPLVPNPSGDANFEAAEFNANLSPTVEVCAWTGTCGAVVATFTMSSGLGGETITVSPTDQQYRVNWHTDLSNLDPTITYRIRVLVGRQEPLGFADIDVVSSGRELKNVNTLDYIGLVDGRTLPIKFRIENAALCDPPGGDCTSASVNLADDVPDEVTLPTGDGVTIPPQNDGGQNVAVTITVQECEDDIDVDLPVFGRCVSITADPPLDGALDPPALIQVCDVDFDVHAAGLSPEQERLVTLHRQSGETIQALPHADDDCEQPGPIGSAPATGLKGLAQAILGLMGRGLATVVEPRALHASIAVFDVGGGGESDFFSDFQFALPAQMAAVEGTDRQTAAAGTAVSLAPAVFVSDRNGSAVAGARVTFSVTDGGGLLGSTGTFVATSDGEGIAAPPSWILGSQLDANTVRASGRGIADPQDGGPFMPGLPTDPEPGPQVPVTLVTGAVDFEAFAFQDVGATTVNANHYLLNLSPGMYADAEFHNTDILFSGALSYGNSSTAVLVYNSRTALADFGGTSIRVQKPGPLADHYTFTVMNEAPKPSPTGKVGLGLRIVRETFAFGNTVDQDYVIVKYTIHNPGEATVNGLHVGEIIDADVGGLPEPSTAQASDDVVEYVSALQMARVSSPGNPPIGFILLSDPVTSYRAFRNPSVEGPAVMDPATNAEWFTFLSGGIERPDTPFGPSDIRHVLSHGPASIPAGGSRVVAVALLGGADAANLAVNVAAARAKWSTLPGGPTPLP